MKKAENLLVIACLTLLPFLCGAVKCMGNGMTITDIYLPNSTWNDEVMYFKMLEGGAEYGIPQGYFGYNESHAAYLSFGPWSPLLFLFSYVFAKISGGWYLLSPILCNLFLMSAAMFLFAVLAKPTKLQAVVIGGFYAAFSISTRYVLSGMQETACYFLVILMTALIYKSRNIITGHKRMLFVLLNAAVMLLTLMRPYYVVFAVLPGYYAYVNSRDKRFLSVQSFLMVFYLAGYAWISKYLCAAYFGPIIRTEWISGIFRNPGEGLFQLGCQLIHSLKTMLALIGDGITDGDPGGACYTIYLLLIFWLLYRSMQNFKNKKNVFLCSYFLAVNLLMLLAVFLFYDVATGSRHLIPFVICEMLVLGMEEENGRFTTAVFLSLIWLFGVKGADDIDYYRLPAITDDMEREIAEGKELLKDAISVEPGGSRWDNTVIWLLSDETDVTWQDLYAFPAGIGINVCTRDYVIANYGQLKSKYLMTNSRGEAVEVLCSQNGAQFIAEYGQTHVWKLRDS